MIPSKVKCSMLLFVCFGLTGSSVFAIVVGLWSGCGRGHRLGGARRTGLGVSGERGR